MQRQVCLVGPCFLSMLTASSHICQASRSEGQLVRDKLPCLFDRSTASRRIWCVWLDVSSRACDASGSSELAFSRAKEANLILAKPRSVQEHVDLSCEEEGNFAVSVFCHPCVMTLACEELDFSSSRTTVI